MKKVNLMLLAFIIIAFLSVNSYALSSQTTTTTAKTTEDNKSKKEDKETTTTLPPEVQNGITAGSLDGAHDAHKAYFNGDKNDYSKSLPSYKDIIERYNLSIETGFYRTAFIDAYRVAYKKAYELAYHEMNMESTLSSAEKGAVSGETFGLPEGAHMAQLDILNNQVSDWLKAYNHFVDSANLESRYQLERFDARFIEYFKTSFKNSFKVAYKEEFLKYAVDIEMNGLNYQLITYFEDSVIYTKVMDSVANGRKIQKTAPTASIVVEKGTVYQDTYLGLHEVGNINYQNKTLFSPASAVYEVSTRGANDSVKLYKPIQLRFAYNDQPRLGIYQWQYNRWLYMPTIFTDEDIYLEIPMGDYKGGKYRVFIDDTYKVPSDIAYSWAYDEIIMATRRHHLLNETNFRPNVSMTRMELADIIYRTMQYRTVPTQFRGTVSDKGIIADKLYKVHYVLSMNYMKLDANNAFNPNQYITYSELEWAVARMTRRNFSYSLIASKMFYDKYTISAYNTNKNGNPSRAEVIYTLNEMIN